MGASKTDESARRRRISMSLKRQYANGTRKYVNPTTGKRHSQETIEKMRVAARKRVEEGRFNYPTRGLLESDHPQWKGDDVGREGLHAWVIKNLGKPLECEHCGKQNAIDWANKSGNYLRQLDDWIRLCRSCHMRYDFKMGFRKG